MTKILSMNTELDFAIWAITPGGLCIAKKLMGNLKGAVLFLSENIGDEPDAISFKRLAPAVSEHFARYKGHIFIMSTGIVVRMMANLIEHKTKDPAVVVVNDTGEFAIPLLSGHIGGANELAKSIAAITNGIPVITTATDSNNLPAIDIIAKQKNLIIENPEAIKIINMAFIKNTQFVLNDPYNQIIDLIPEQFLDNSKKMNDNIPVIEVSDLEKTNQKNTLYLRPQLLSVGVGCNRGTPISEIKNLMSEVFQESGLSILSIQNIATIDIKKGESGILDLAVELGVPIQFYDSEALNRVDSIQNPSNYAKKYTGARSVCEAAAILAAESGKLIVTKKKTKNVTIAVARVGTDSMS